MSMQDFFTKSEAQLSFIMQLSGPQVRNVIGTVSEAICPPITTAAELLSILTPRVNHLRTYLPTLDQLMHGGLLFGSLTEICGPPGVGKTQFCYLACLSALMPTDAGGLGNNSRVMYVDIENKFNPNRFFEIAYNRFPEVYAPNGIVNEILIHEMLDRLTVIRFEDKDQFQLWLESLLMTSSSSCCELLIIDSIAAIARKEFTRDKLAERQMWLLHISAILKEISDFSHIPILLTNQVISDDSMNMTVKPALGVAWHHCVSSRLCLSLHVSGRRYLTIAKSPICRQTTINVIIDTAGLKEGECSNEVSKGDVDTIAKLILDYNE